MIIEIIDNNFDLSIKSNVWENEKNVAKTVTIQKISQKCRFDISHFNIPKIKKFTRIINFMILSNLFPENWHSLNVRYDAPKSIT